MTRILSLFGLLLLSVTLSAQSAARSNAFAVSFESMTVSSTAVAFAPATLGAVAVTSSSVASQSLITTGASHNLAIGQSVVIAGHSGSTPSINGTQTVAAVVSATTFRINLAVTVGGTGGTALGPEPGGQIHPTFCEGVVETNAIRYRADGTNPTAAIGVPLAAGDRLQISGYRVLQGLRLIRQSADATIYWQCYRE